MIVPKQRWIEMSLVWCGVDRLSLKLIPTPCFSLAWNQTRNIISLQGNLSGLEQQIERQITASLRSS